MTVAADPYCLDDDEAVELLQDSPWCRFVVIGDSMAAGVGDDVPGYPSGGWAATVARVLRRVHPDLAYLNLGERDRYAAEVREQQLPPALAFRPDLAVVLAGGNDMLRRRFDVDVMADELDAMVGALSEHASAVVTFGPMDITRSDIALGDGGAVLGERLRAYGEAVGERARRHGAAHIVMTEHPAAAQRSTYSADLLHLSARGHAVIAAETVRRLAQLAT
ncbi:MAG TPA: SGNH/GDSL hydrolase family protein [Jatrophihabitantaceae bacterium]|nr:SGNH/GDSL hydrolase family protein [Jatrophihabitantaceae bacterium]